MRAAWTILLLVACESSKAQSLGGYAVGTYIGRGPLILGVVGYKDCTYTGGPTVFQPGVGAAPGPRFITAPGKIEVTCEVYKQTGALSGPILEEQTVTFEAQAYVATGATISGPATANVGTPSQLFIGYLAAAGRELKGDTTIDWSLGKDCDGVAAYAPAFDSQELYGPDRARVLQSTAKGECTVILTMTTGSSQHGASFRAEQLVTIQ
jgi:hypothetical protein